MPILEWNDATCSPRRHQGKSSVMFLPIIYMLGMNPSDVTCVSSTFHFVSKHAKQHSIANPIIMFDQPLWLKAFNIIEGAS